MQTWLLKGVLEKFAEYGLDDMIHAFLPADRLNVYYELREVLKDVK